MDSIPRIPRNRMSICNKASSAHIGDPLHFTTDLKVAVCSNMKNPPEKSLQLNFINLMAHRWFCGARAFNNSKTMEEPVLSERVSKMLLIKKNNNM